MTPDMVNASRSPQRSPHDDDDCTASSTQNWQISSKSASNMNPRLEAEQLEAALEREALERARQEHREECRKAFQRPVRKEQVVARPRDRMPPREAQVAARQRAGSRR